MRVPLIPGKVLQTPRFVPGHIPRPPYATNGTGWALESWRAPLAKYELNSKEVNGLRIANKLAAQALQYGLSLVKPGVTTEYIDEKVHNYICSKNAYPSPLGYNNFQKSICTSLNEVLCHGIPDDRAIQDGDIINLDVSCYIEGVHGDTSKTITVGNVDASARKLVDFAEDCLNQCIRLCHPGVPIRKIGDLVSELCEKEGYGTNQAFVGHGIGKLFHMQPLIYHFRQKVDFHKGMVMEKGMVFTIEPIITEGSAEHVEWSDGWTIASKDGKWSAQFEHCILITDENTAGHEILTLP